MLIVEDEYLSRRILMAHLAGCGRCELAVNGEEALRAVRLSHETGDRIDLVLLDIMLPTMDGLSTLKAIRAYELEHGVSGGASAKIIMLTALGNASAIMESVESQCEGYITKPYTKLELMEAISRLDFADGTPR
jgi:two-component system chemotaxis response regulator CheY